MFGRQLGKPHSLKIKSVKGGGGKRRDTKVGWWVLGTVFVKFRATGLYE